MKYRGVKRRCRVLLASSSSRKALAIAYSIRKLLGCHIIAVFANKFHPYITSRVFNTKLVTGSVRGTREWALEIAYLSHRFDVDLVVPIDFIDVLSLSKYKSLFERLKVNVAVPDYDKVTVVSNKAVLGSIVSDICNIPKTLSVNDVKRVFSELRPPLVIKGFSDASKPRYVSYLEGALDYVKGTDEIIQEFFPGIGRGYFTVSINGEPLIEFTHQRVIEYDPIGGASLMAFGPIHDPRLYRIGRKIIWKLKWTGPLMVETRWNPETGDYVVLEINPKFWGSIDLPVKLNYQLPAILAAAFIYGIDHAKKLARRLMVRTGFHSWVLDGIRYIAKDVGTWLRLLSKALSNVPLSDLSPIDPARVFSQVIVGLRKLSKERVEWVKSLSHDIVKVKKFLSKAINNLKHLRLGDLCLILDLDSTLVKLNIDWKFIRRECIKKKLLTHGETISMRFYKLWLNDKIGYHRFSKLIEEYERKFISKYGYEQLIKEDMLNEILSLNAKGLNLCIATKQPESIATEIVSKLLPSGKLTVIGRDSGYGPLKIDMFRSCVKLMNSKKAIVIDDAFTAVVDAVREGFIAIRVTNNSYEFLKTIRLGILALPHERAFKFAIKLLRTLSA